MKERRLSTVGLESGDDGVHVTGLSALQRSRAPDVLSSPFLDHGPHSAVPSWGSQVETVFSPCRASPARPILRERRRWPGPVSRGELRCRRFHRQGRLDCRRSLTRREGKDEIASFIALLFLRACAKQHAKIRPRQGACSSLDRAAAF